MLWLLNILVRASLVAFCSGSFWTCSNAQRSDSSDTLARPHRTADLVDYEPSLPAQTVGGGGAYVAITQDVMTGITYMQTGSSIHEAIEESLRTCRLFSSEMDGQCTTMSVYSTRLSATLTGDIPNSWDCFARDNPITGEIDKPRYWLNTGKTIEAAKENVLKMCQIEGGVGCSLDRCYNGGRDKIR
jgi:hypothetical protein